MRPSLRPLLAALSLLLVSPTSQAVEFEFLGVSANTKLTANYAVAMRMKRADPALIDGPVDPLQAGPVEDYENRPGQPPNCLTNPDPSVCRSASFGRTGLSTTINSDDGNRSFKRYDLFQNRISLFGELQLKRDNFGMAFSGDAFYNDAYLRKNANRSEDTVNKTGSVNVFTRDTKRFDGKRVRLLDAYAYADFNVTETTPVNFRIGQQVIAFGESLFLRGMALSSGRADATRASVPGAEIKELLLPINQIGLSVGLPGGITFLGYYQLEFKETELFPIGDYLSPVDIIGPGATFAYGSINPLAGAGCEGLVPPPLDLACNTGMGLENAPRTINVQRKEDIVPDENHFGFGFKIPVTDTTTIGLYRIRYADSNPTVKLTFGCAFLGELAGQTVTTCAPPVINQFVPVEYQAKYFGGIDLTSITFSTAYGPFNFAGEFNYRENSDVQVKGIASKVLAPFFTTADVGQVLLSALTVFNPQIFFDEFVFVGEAGYVHVYDVDPIEEEFGLIPVGNGDELFTNRNSWGFQFLSFATKRNLIPGMDFKTTLSYGMIVKGNPSLSGAFGPIFGEGDRRLGIGVSAQYLQNLEVALNYQFFIGDANKVQRGSASESDAGGSNLAQNPYADRDYIALNFKYNL